MKQNLQIGKQLRNPGSFVEEDASLTKIKMKTWHFKRKKITFFMISSNNQCIDFDKPWIRERFFCKQFNSARKKEIKLL